MWGFLGKLLGRKATPEGQAGGELMRRATANFMGRQDDPPVSAFWDEGERGWQEYDEFCERFEHQPGTNFMAFVRTQNIPELERWLHPSNPSPEAKVFIRVIVEMMQRGETIGEQPGILVYADDYLRREAANPQETRDILDALATLSQIVKMPIKLFFDGAEGKIKVWDFEP